MAVEIPVVIDIEAAFADAAKRVGQASAPLRKAMDDLNKDLELFRDKMNSYSVGSKNFELAAKNVMKLEEAIDLVNAKINEFTTRSGSVRRLSGELKVIKQQFERMGESQMFDASGKLSADAKKLQSDYARVAEHLDRVRTILTQEYETQKKARLEAELQVKAVKERNDAITGYVNSLGSLNARLAALRTEIGSVDMYNDPSRFKALAEAIGFTTRRIATLNAEVRRFGAQTGSVDQLSAKLRALSEEYNALSDGQRRFGDRAKQIKKEYIDISKELEKESGVLEKAARIEMEREKNARKKANALRAENSILETTQKTMAGLQMQEKILSDRLSKTAIGSNKYRQLKVDLEAVRAEIQAVNGGLTTQSTIMSNLSSMASMYFSVFGLLRFAKQVRDVTGELEYQRVALGHLIQDEEYGAKLFEQIKEAAIESPFRIKDLVTYTKQLAAYRIEQENLFDTTKRLADISAGLGVDMNRLILAYGQVRAASVLRGQELRQFTEAGIPLVELLTEKMGELNKTTYTTADIFKLISERAVPFSAISEIFEDLTEKGGMFYEMQERQAETLKGRWEKLKDAFDIGLQAAGETKTFEWQNKLVLNILTLLAKNINLVPKVVEALGYAWAGYAVVARLVVTRNKEIVASNKLVMTTEQLKQAGVSKTAISMFGQERATKMLIKSNAALSASNGFLTKTFARLRLAMLSNPYAAIAGAIAGLASMFIFWNKKTKESTSSLDELDNRIDEISRATKKFERSEKLIARYKELASNTNRTTEENNRLQKTMSNLISLFPELADAINDENRSLDDNVRLLEQRNEYLIQQSKDKATESLVNAREDLKKYNKEVRDSEKKWAEAEHNAALFLDGRSYEELYKSQQKAYDKLRKEADEEAKKRDDAIQKRNNTAKRIEALERYLAPWTKAFDTAWQNTLMRMKDVKVGEKTISLIGDSDIRGYESIYKALQKIDKAYVDSSNSLKEMRVSLSSVSSEYRKQAEEEIAVEQARRDGYKAILDTFGYISSLDKKRGVSDLTILKEELKTVQDIYKRYQEFEKYMGKGAARQKIEQIYGGVTAIDFLDPDSFKHRISQILEQLRALQGRIISGAKTITKESFDNLKETIKKNEGFREDAYKLAGEPYYTIGYGFYKNLPDGRKVSEGMKMTREEADKLLDLGIENRIKYVNEQIRKYGEGLVFNEKQMNVLLDLSWQSAHGVERVLREAKGDASKIIEGLKTAASGYLVSKDENIYAGVKKRDMRRAEAFAKAMAEEAEDSDAIAQAVGEAEKLVQDVDWDEFKRALDEKLKQVSDDIKRSETARNFYKDILNLTGDEELAATMSVSVYGGIGDDFKERIKKQLVGALDSLDANTFAGLDDAIRAAFDSGDYQYLMKNIGSVPEKLRDIVKQVSVDAEKYNADIVKSYAKLLTEYDDIEQQRVNITQKSAKSIADVEAGLQLELKAMREKGASSADLQAAKDRADSAKGAVARQAAVDLSRLEKDYRLFFSSVGVISEKAARKVAASQKKMITDQFVRGEISLSKYKREIGEIDKQLEKYTSNRGMFATYLAEGLNGALSKLNEYADSVRSFASTLTVGKGGVWTPTDEDKEFLNKMNDVLNLGAFARIFQKKGVVANLEVSINNAAQNAYTKAIEKGLSEAAAIKEAAAAASSEAAAAGDEMAAAASSIAGGIAEFELIFNTVDSWIRFIEKDLEASEIEGGKVEDWIYSLFGFNDNITKAWNTLKSGDIFGAIWDIAMAIGEIGKPTKLINKQIKEQYELIDDLTREYNRLGVALEKSFGSDYVSNYNQQLTVLQAKVDAYRKQAELEAAKGKKANLDTVKGYEKSARDVEDQIADMQTQLSEFFTDMDVTSAAKDFAQAWIDAYQEFGSTTDAMREKFDEMIENMVVNSLAAQLIQGILKPIFKEIDDAAERGALTAEDIARISGMVPNAMAQIDAGMTGLMNQLTAAGVNLRQQAGSFTGISRDIASASEESITGLAAGINTQNFYIQHIDQNVALILSVLTGGSTTAQASVTGQVADPYKDQMLQYAALMPDMHDDIHNIYLLLNGVIRARGEQTTKVVHTNL